MWSTRLSSSLAIVRERENTSLEKSRCSVACMNSSTNTATSLSTIRNPSPSELSDAELLMATRSLVGRSNQLLAALLAHLGEVEARGIHRIRACSSLYVYCIYELRYSEDEAYRRVAAARLVRRFPALLDAVASGELHLTGLLMLGPHLTEQNISQVLLRAKHRTKKEIARLVRELDPLPEVPPRIEPLGPAPARLVPAAPTWQAFVSSLCPVRELSPGERPRDWMEDASEGDAAASAGFTLSDNEAVSTRAGVGASGQDPLAEPLSPQRYKVQFTAGEEYVKLVEEAQALLSHSAPRATLDEIQLRAMRALVTELKRRKHAATARPKKPPAESTDASRSTARGESARKSEPKSEFEHPPSDAKSRESRVETESPRRRGRHVPAAVRRAVFERDQARCTYADPLGRRCAETHRLELHHLSAFALGGEHTKENLTLRCRAHNALAAEQAFGRDFIELARGASEHEPWTAQPGA
jgi:5-methylcytosine-specific restriction endonuclease McrA